MLREITTQHVHAMSRLSQQNTVFPAGVTVTPRAISFSTAATLLGCDEYTVAFRRHVETLSALEQQLGKRNGRVGLDSQFEGVGALRVNVQQPVCIHEHQPCSVVPVMDEVEELLSGVTIQVPLGLNVQVALALSAMDLKL
jgi:hypothetical protein